MQYALGEDTVGGGGRVCAREETVRDVLRLFDGGLASHEMVRLTSSKSSISTFPLVTSSSQMLLSLPISSP